MLEQVFGSDRASSSLVRSYKRSFNGFVAKLTEDEMQQMKGMDGVVSVFPSEKKQLHTTRSWDFVGFPRQVKRTSVESDIIIGVLDGGIWPESDSFDDKGFGRTAKEMEGHLPRVFQFHLQQVNLTRNRVKIIGAKYYKSDRKFSPEDLQSPRDSDGHGTHTASTAAGGLVNMASLMGFGLGTARGGVPSARIAVYKICWSDGCDDADILAAFDDAIADGVDIISYSLGNPPSQDYFKDTAAIGAFHAMKNGILTSTSAGNDGPRLVSVVSVSPWSLSVAASTIDRKFFDRGATRFCEKNSLNPNLVKGKIVLCIGLGAGLEETSNAFLAGAVGTVIVDGLRFPKDSSYIYPLPASRLGAGDGKRIGLLHQLNKPDLTAPGVHILAAWSPISPISQMSGDNRVAQYNILSGTSMACPHATGAAAYIKSFHPTWSPAAIKSALMTTEKSGSRIAYGAGNIDPVRAVHPGLVYDADEIDFVNFLCGEGYSFQTLRKSHRGS
ncbi:Cucumisin [Vitis vinifera]|uniref:Cucumisin n=1 Tax=Vitis vinifera TaxID=29760 RepID=A0A438JXI4_VITVI|nr:Cucumisin [Vitis vinifera]